MMAFLCCCLPATLFAGRDQVAEIQADHAVGRIAFGSCLRKPDGAQILDKVLAYKPDLFIWLGDNIYADTLDQPARFDELYGRLGANPRFQKLSDTCPQLAIWDDHDYGADNSGMTYPLKEPSKLAFGKFWRVPEKSAFWHREGIYRAVEYGSAGQRVQVILLDGRWHLDQANPAEKGSYLGEAQWAWLGEVLERPAKVRVICSGVQVIKLNGNGKNWEMWGHHPTERQRLFDLIGSTKAAGVVFISGDMHFGEIFKTTDTAYPFHDITASGMDQIHGHAGKTQPGPEQIGSSLIKSLNFGGLVIDWEKSVLQLEILNGEGEAFLSHPVPLGDLQAGG
ncbi:alkaline phosphatase family protein [Akkermansiaceae bacterium]|nr:alkaline phosphatase family protein [Akkermansiaceae bacterium]